MSNIILSDKHIPCGYMGILGCNGYEVSDKRVRFYLLIQTASTKKGCSMYSNTGRIFRPNTNFQEIKSQEHSL